MANGFKTYFLLLIITVIAFSCKKDAPPTVLQQGSITTSKRLLICDEGGFGYNNSGISVYDPSSNGTIINAYAAANSNQSLGDVLQSVTKYNDKYYLVVNNSGKIVVCDRNLKRLATISGFISPRYMQVVSNNKAYVSNLKLPTNSNQTNYLQVLNLTTNTITKSIRLDGWAEQMVESYGKVYITNQNKKYVYVIDALSDKLDSIYAGATNACIIKDANEKIWVSCNADSIHSIPSSLIKINPVNDSIEAIVSLNNTHNSISRLSINGSGTTLFYLMNDVYKMDIINNSRTNLIPQGANNFYGLCVDPTDETIYISDAGNYNSNGKLYRYQSNGSYVGTFLVGLIPGFMMMDE